MSDPHKSSEPALREEDLTAYLDGELGPEATQRVERLLAEDPRVRLEVQRLQRAWDLLDELPRTELGEQFTRSTVALVAVAAEEDLERAQAAEPARRRRAWLLAGLSLVAACLAGFAALRVWLPDPNQVLLRDLTVLEHLDEYRQVQDMEFLRLLHQDGALDEEVGDALPAVALAAGFSLDDRRQRAEEMTAEQRHDLLQSQQRLADFDPQEQERLRRLDAELAADPQADSLRQTMALYYAWLKTIEEPEKRAELRGLPPAERLARVKEIRADQAREAEKRLTPDDQQALAAWLETVVRSRLPADRLEEFDNAEQHERMWIIAGEVWGRQGPGGQTIRPFAKRLKAEEAQALYDALSPEAQARLDARQTVQEKRELVGDWIGGLFWRRGRRFDWMRAPDPQLERFFREGLTPEQKRELRDMPDEWSRHQRFLEFYRQWREKEGLPPLEPQGFFRPPGGRGEGARPNQPPRGRPGKTARPQGESPPAPEP